MSSLTSSQINQTYQGLLKLANSTTGITSSIQSVQDGLGNDTGLQIATDRFEGGNIFNVYKPGVAPYYGPGFITTAAPQITNSSNLIVTVPFYDVGNTSYSAFTINVTTLGALESLDIAFYNAQRLPTYGYVPYQKLSTEINISTTSSGLKTGTFASPLSFSGQGPGFYFIVFRFNSPNLTPSTRVGRSIVYGGLGFIEGMMMSQLGIVANAAGSLYPAPYQVSSTLAFSNTYNTPTFPSTWTATEFATLSGGSIQGVNPGFILHTEI
jgi:hypothetical protein